jgi:Reverse transcriptase (RNA-dependent DNA polymerase).
VKYADDLMLLAKEETVLQGMINRLIEILKCYGMGINVEKTKVKRNSREPSPVQIMVDQKQLDSVDYFSYLDSMITNNERCKHEVQSRIATSKATFNKKKVHLFRKLDLNLKKKPVKCYICSLSLYGAETWTLRKVDHIYLEGFAVWCWRRI